MPWFTVGFHNFRFFSSSKTSPPGSIAISRTNIDYNRFTKNNGRRTKALNTYFRICEASAYPWNTEYLLMNSLAVFLAKYTLQILCSTFTFVRLVSCKPWNSGGKGTKLGMISNRAKYSVNERYSWISERHAISTLCLYHTCL